MIDIFLDQGLLSLLVVSFGASTLLPFGSEWLLVLLLFEGHNPSASVATATIGNTLGSWTNYLIGRWGSLWLTEKVFRLQAAQRNRAENWFRRYGSWSLLLAWLPIIGDPLCLVSGMFKTPMVRFFLFVTTGKCLRYSALAYIVLKSTDIIPRSGF